MRREMRLLNINYSQKVIEKFKDINQIILIYRIFMYISALRAQLEIKILN